MPINFEPPGPFAPGISAGYGAAQVRQQNFATIAGLYANNQRLAVEAQQQQAQMRQQAALADQHAQLGYAQLATQAQERGREQAQNLGERQAEYAASREPSARDAYMAQAQSNDLRQKAELQAWLSQQEVGQAELMQYQRQKNAVSEVMDPSNGLLPHERQSMLLKLKAGMSDVELRMKNQQAEHLEAQNKQIDAQIQRQAQHEQTNRDFEAAMLQQGKGAVRMVDDNGRTHFLLKNEKSGEWYNPLVKGAGEGGGADDKLDSKTQDEYHKAFVQATGIVDKWAAATQKDDKGAAQPLYPDYRDKDKYRQAVLTKTLDLLGLPQQEGPSPESISAALSAKRKAGRGQPGGQGDAGAGGDFGGETRSTAAPPGQPGAAAPEAVTATLNIYRQAAEDFQGALKLSPEERTQGTVAARQTAALLEKSGGDLARLSPDERQLYERAREHQITLARLNKERAEKARRAAPRAQPSRPAVGVEGPGGAFI